MEWIWIIYWGLLLISFIIGLVVFIKKKEKMWLGILQSLLTILVSIWAFIFSLHRNWTTENELEFLLSKLQTWNLEAITLTLTFLILIVIFIHNLFICKKPKPTKQKIETFTIIGVLLMIFILFSTMMKNQKNIVDSQSLWLIYDQNLENIKNNMDLITIPNENFYWWELKNLNIEDQEYKQTLNNLVADIRMCYLEFTDNGELYTNANPIKAYRNKNSITQKELNQLAFQMKNSSCLTRFTRYKSLLISNDPMKRTLVLDKIQNIIQIQNEEIWIKKTPTYSELLSQKIIEVSLINNISSWINSEYYRLT